MTPNQAYKAVSQLVKQGKSSIELGGVKDLLDEAEIDFATHSGVSFGQHYASAISFKLDGVSMIAHRVPDWYRPIKKANTIFYKGGVR